MNYEQERLILEIIEASKALEESMNKKKKPVADGSITITHNPAGKPGVNPGRRRTDVLREE